MTILLLARITDNSIELADEECIYENVAVLSISFCGYSDINIITIGNIFLPRCTLFHPNSNFPCST